MAAANTHEITTIICPAVPCELSAGSLVPEADQKRVSAMTHHPKTPYLKAVPALNRRPVGLRPVMHLHE
jgi:hypothetical protein